MGFHAAHLVWSVMEITKTSASLYEDVVFKDLLAILCSIKWPLWCHYKTLKDKAELLILYAGTVKKFNISLVLRPLLP